MNTNVSIEVQTAIQRTSIAVKRRVLCNLYRKKINKVDSENRLNVVTLMQIPKK